MELEQRIETLQQGIRGVKERLEKFNPNHVPSGPKGGQFAPGSGGSSGLGVAGSTSHGAKLDDLSRKATNATNAAVKASREATARRVRSNPELAKKAAVLHGEAADLHDKASREYKLAASKAPDKSRGRFTTAATAHYHQSNWHTQQMGLEESRYKVGS